MFSPWKFLLLFFTQALGLFLNHQPTMWYLLFPRKTFSLQWLYCFTDTEIVNRRLLAKHLCSNSFVPGGLELTERPVLRRLKSFVSAPDDPMRANQTGPSWMLWLPGVILLTRTGMDPPNLSRAPSPEFDSVPRSSQTWTVWRSRTHLGMAIRLLHQHSSVHKTGMTKIYSFGK